MNLSINSTTKVDFSKWYYVEDAFSVEEIDKIHWMAGKGGVGGGGGGGGGRGSLW